MKMFRKMWAVILCVLMLFAITSVAFAVDAREPRPPCLSCGIGYRIYQYGPIESDDEEIACQHGGFGADIVEIRFQEVYVSCSDCSYHDQYRNYLPQTLLYCPCWG
mgnify:CR=1 FL=1